MNLDNLSISDLENLLEQVSNEIMCRKEPKQVMGKKIDLKGELHMCYGKVQYQSLKHANKRLKNLTEQYKVAYRVYECPVCGCFHLTTKV